MPVAGDTHESVHGFVGYLSPFLTSFSACLKYIISPLGTQKVSFLSFLRIPKGGSWGVILDELCPSRAS